MPSSAGLLRPIIRKITAIVGGILTTISGQQLTTVSDQPLETIQSA